MNYFKRFPIPGGDAGVWDGFEQDINLLGLGNSTLKLYDDSGVLKLNNGRCGLDDGSQKGACVVDTVTTIPIAALTVSLWAKIELSKSGSTLNIEITSITGENDPAVLPSSFTGGYDGDKQGYYITGTKRCIGLAWINAAGSLEGIINCLSGESFSGYATTNDADDYVYEFVKLNGRDLFTLKIDSSSNLSFESDVSFESEVTFEGNIVYNSQSLRQWYDIEDPTAGWFAQKTSGWTADRFTAVSGGMEIDFSSVVPAGTKKVKVFLRVSPGAQYDVYCRPAGDDTFASNTPVANNEYFATISSMIFYSTGSAGGGRLVDLILNESGVCEIAVSNTGMDLNFSYPVAVYAPILPA